MPGSISFELRQIRDGPRVRTVSPVIEENEDGNFENLLYGCPIFPGFGSMLAVGYEIRKLSVNLSLLATEESKMIKFSEIKLILLRI